MMHTWSRGGSRGGCGSTAPDARASRCECPPSDEFPPGESNGAETTRCIFTAGGAAAAPTAATAEATSGALTPREQSVFVPLL